MKTYMEQRDELVKAARDIAEKAQSEERELSVSEANEINAKGVEITELNEKIRAAKSASDLLASLGEAKSDEQRTYEVKFGTLGEYAADGLKDSLGNIKARRRVQADLAEFKSEPPAVSEGLHTVTGTGAGFLQPQIDTNVAKLFRQGPTIASWLGSGEMTSTAITYFAEKAYEPATGNGFGFVAAEGDVKPQLVFPDYEKKTENLARIAGWILLSDQMAEDTPFLVSEINNRLMYQLAMFEESALLNGDGDELTGLMQRSGVQVETAATADDNLEALFRAKMKIARVTGLNADGVVVNPVDYEKIRLAKDAQGNYLAGGPFYGNVYSGGNMSDTPPIWGMSNIIATNAVPEGTALVGAGRVGATVYRKGGIRVEASNATNDDFIRNQFRVLAEERLTLAVRQPAAFVKVTLAS